MPNSVGNGIPFDIDVGSSAMQSPSNPFPDTTNVWNSSGIYDPAKGDIGSWLSRVFDFSGTWAAKDQYNRQMYLDELARQFNAGEAQKQRDWEEKMDATKYQRLVKDLEAAGLNPYLAVANNLSGGSSLSGSTASQSSSSAGQANNKLAAAAGLFAMFMRIILGKGK